MVLQALLVNTFLILALKILLLESPNGGAGFASVVDE